MSSSNETELPRTRRDAKQCGVKRYFTAEECIRGHISERLTSTGHCLECVRAQKLAWFHAHAEQERPKSRIWKNENKERNGETTRAWRLANREIVTANKKRAYRKAMLERPEKVRAKSRANYAANLERERNRSRQKQRKNPLAAAVREQRRRARMREAVGNFTVADIVGIRKLQRDRCACCQAFLKGKGHIDHIVPLSRGGSNERRNLQILCRPCNLSKSCRDPIEFMQSRGALL
jgi:5-methylcytosine-specific restriction endonuclease McrA